MYIETARMCIRDFTMVDVADLHEILGDEICMAYSEPAYDFEKTKSFLASFCVQRGGAVAGALREGGKVIGYLLFSELSPGVYEIGWFFNRRFWRQGYAYEACRALIDDAFSRGRAHKICAETIDVQRSVPLMQKLGMYPEGVQREQMRDQNGQWADLYLYGLLAEDRGV